MNTLRKVCWSSIAVCLLLMGGMAILHSEGPYNIADGKEAFQENCAACHNSAHRVGPPLAKHVGYFVRAGSPLSLFAASLPGVVRKRPPESKMPSFPVDELSDAQVANIAAYLYSLTPTPATPPAAGDAQRGAWLFSVACASCHGDAGEGKGRAPALAAIANMFKGMMPKDEKGNASSTPMLGIVMLATRSGDIRMPTFSPAKLSDAQLADITAYIWTLPPPPPPPAGTPPREGSAGGR